MSTNKAWCSWSLPKHRAALASVHWVWHSLSKLSVPNLQISDLLLHFALPSPHDCGCSGAGRASVAAGPGAGCVGAAVGTESGNFATPAGVGSLLNYPQRLFAEASRSLLGKCCLGRRVVPWNSILDVMHKSVSIWSIRNMLKRHNFLNLALEPWRAWTLNRRLTPPQELFEVCMERSSIVQYLYVIICFSQRWNADSSLFARCCCPRSVPSQVSEHISHVGCKETLWHSPKCFACQDAFVFAVSSRGTHSQTHTGTGRFCSIQFAYLLVSFWVQNFLSDCLPS